MLRSIAFVGGITDESGELKILFLSPVIKWMVMALSAANLCAEEDLGRVADIV